MGLNNGEFLGTVSIGLGSIMILPVFSTKMPAGFPHSGDTLYASDYGKKRDGKMEGGSYPFVAFPSRIAPELVQHLQNFRRN
ncbi:MAG: hypothetical protein L0Z48_11265 [candidate division Zixibacteria bacterium]|nr:hypothetical protein [candidate division Zixibacteria bacterium]